MKAPSPHRHRADEAAAEASASAVLRNRYGLHMRPAKQVVELANTFPCEISLLVDGRDADAKSILGVIGLAAECGEEVVVRARGDGADEAARRLADVLTNLPELHGEPEGTGCEEDEQDEGEDGRE